MNKLNIILYGNGLLRQKCEVVSCIDDNIKSILDEMVQLMKQENGVGLASSQVGLLKRMIVVMNPNDNRIIKMINPLITFKSDKKIILEEGCLSILGHDNMPIFAKVERPQDIQVKWLDETGDKKTEKFSGIISRIIQHEIDHLDGVLFTDYLSSLKRNLMLRKVKKSK